MTDSVFDLKQIRGNLKLSQEEMASKLDISREHYSRMENDSDLFRKSKIDLAIKLSILAGITLNQINFFY